MIVLAIVLFLVVALVVASAFVLGFRRGSQSWIAEVQRVRAEAAVAERQLHDITRAAFVAMAEKAEGRRSPGGRLVTGNPGTGIAE